MQTTPGDGGAGDGLALLLSTTAARAPSSAIDFRVIADKSLSLIVVADHTGCILYVNEAFCAATGFASTQLIGQEIQDFGQLGEPDLMGLRDALGFGLPWQGEFAAFKKDGDRMWLNASITPVADEEGNVTHFLATGLDITERKHAEEALRESEEKFRALVDRVPAAITIVQGMRFRFANAAAEAISGYSRDELANLDFWEAVHPDHQHIVKERGLARQEGKEPPSQYEVKFLSKSGEERWGLITAGVIEFEGAPATVGTMIDITERRAAEQALLASEQKFRALAETHPASTFITQGDRYTFVNKAMQRALGYSEAELLQLNFWSVVHPDFVDLVKERAWARQRGEDVPGEYEIKFVTKSGDTRWGLVSAAPIAYEGAPAILGGILDITESKTAEASLRASEEKFRMQAETVPAATFIVQGTRLRFANSTASAMLGYTREELLVMNFYDFIHPDLQGVAKDRGLARQRGEDVPAQYEIRFVTKAGEKRWGIITAARMQYEGAPAIIGSVIDITERKAGEEALHTSEERYRILYQENPAMYFTLASDLTVLLVNRFGVERLGYQSEELVGKAVFGVVYPADRNAVRRQLKALLSEDNDRGHLEFRKVTKDGEVIWVEEIVRRTHDADGNPILLVVCEDITERRRTEETLRRLREDLERKVEKVLGKGNPYDLSFRELTVLHLVVSGRSDKEIAVTLGIRPLTVSKHVANVLKKMNAASRTEAGVRAWREGLIG